MLGFGGAWRRTKVGRFPPLPSSLPRRTLSQIQCQGPGHIDRQEAPPVALQGVPRKVDSKSVDSKSVDSKSVESKSVKSKPVDSQPVESKPVEIKPVEIKPVESKPVDTQPADSNSTVSTPKRKLGLGKSGIISKTSWLYRGIAKQLNTLTLESITPDDEPVTSTGGFETLCSYNWTTDKHPTILVPGGAPKWAPLKCPIQIDPDKGYQYPNPNVAKNQARPFEPIFAALSAMSPKLKLDDVDLILRRNTLRDLLKFVRCKQGLKLAQLRLHLINNTLMIDERDNHPRRRKMPKKIPEWGSSFESIFTEYPPELKGSMCHHRLIAYRFGSLKIAVYHDVDASYSPLTTTILDKEPRLPSVAPNINTNPHKLRTKVKMVGNGTPSSEIAELKSVKSGHSTASATDQLWFGRTPYLIRGPHIKGLFQTPTVIEAEPLFEKWETLNQTLLRKMVSLIKDLRAKVKGVPDPTIAVINRTKRASVLEIFTLTSPQQALHPETIARHWSAPSIGDPSAINKNDNDNNNNNNNKKKENKPKMKKKLIRYIPGAPKPVQYSF